VQRRVLKKRRLQGHTTAGVAATLSHAVAPEKEGNVRSVNRDAAVGPTAFCAIAGRAVAIEPTRNATARGTVGFSFMRAAGKTSPRRGAFEQIF